MTITEKILEILQFQAEMTVSLLDAFMTDKYTSHRKLRRLMLYGPKEFKTDWADAYRKRQQFYSMLNHLKQEGLIENKRRGRTSFWKITKSGLDKLKHSKEKKEKAPSLLDAEFPPPSGRGLTIVVFDVPEREKQKRHWLRICLRTMGFKFLQKSVWACKGKVAEEFIHDLRKYGMLEYVHIFSVNSSGTIREIS